MQKMKLIFSLILVQRSFEKRCCFSNRCEDTTKNECGKQMTTPKIRKLKPINLAQIEEQKSKSNKNLPSLSERQLNNKVLKIQHFKQREQFAMKDEKNIFKNKFCKNRKLSQNLGDQYRQKIIKIEHENIT